MDRRVALGLLWALFAAASVGVGFGAAGLVSDPFTAGGNDVGQVSAPASPAAPSASSASASDAPSGTASSGPSAPARPSSDPETRGVSTRGGFVSGTCRDGLVAVSASPAVGWAIKDVEGGRRSEARVRFERSDGDGRVEVAATCSGGVPRFALKDESGGGEGGSGSSGHGGGD